MKADLQNFFAEFYQNGKFNACIKEKFICLIQKKESAAFVKDFHPISLTTSVYKIITKVLAERLKKVMPDIISSSQSAFIGGRQTTDRVLVANEIVEEYRSKKKKGGFSNLTWKGI